MRASGPAGEILTLSLNGVKGKWEEVTYVDRLDEKALNSVPLSVLLAYRVHSGAQSVEEFVLLRYAPEA